MKKKYVAAVLTLCSIATLSTCSFKFGSKFAQNGNNNISIVNEFNIGKTANFATEITNIVDECDFKDEYDLSETVSIVRDKANAFAEEEDSLAGFVEATLVRVVDGDTIVVEIDGEDYKVRMIGIDTPESVASKEYLDRTGKENTEEGVAASDYTKTLLENVNSVYLEQDVSDKDKYGRLLRYVWVSVPEEINTQSIAENMLNGMLLAEKVAKPATYEPDSKYADDFEDIYDSY